MKPLAKKLSKVNTFIYRFCHYPKTMLLTLLLVSGLVLLFYYYFGVLYPEFKLFDTLASQAGFQHNKKYNFYSGAPKGVYYTIGNALNGPLDDGDSIFNRKTLGGSENAMKLTIEKNSFGLIQEEIMNHDDQLKKNVRIITPLFLERMHIFYRKDLFKTGGREVQLSANTDLCILKCFSDSLININMGPVGSGTKIMASYVMALVEQQINAAFKRKTPRFIQLNESFSTSFEKIRNYETRTDSSIDILFYLSADPMENIESIFKSGKYGMMSIDPSFVVTLNRDFNLALRVADFKDKYDLAKNVSTLATLTYLMASKNIGEDDIYKILKKMDLLKPAIYQSLNKNIGSKDPNRLFEFGFFNLFNNEYESLRDQRLKEGIILLLSIITLFFPVFRSVINLEFVWEKWRMNKAIDDVLRNAGNDQNGEPASAIYSLKEKIVDMYSNGLLSEAQYTPLMKRIDLYQEKFSGKTIKKGKEKIISINQGNKTTQYLS